MKKTFITFVLIVAMLSLSVTAYAEDATSASVTVTYEYTAPEPPPDTPTYILNIPSSVTNDSLGLVEITASKNAIPAGKVLVVTYDSEKSSNNSYFKLYKNKGTDTEEALACRIIVYSDSAKTNGFYLDFPPQPGMESPVAAEFPAGSTTPSYGGFLEFRPLTQYASVSSGTYTGTVYFNIEVKDAD
ncbi:hypothetical protein V6B95_07720 [Thermoanaerobacterium saccharolyticum]|uniref:hypothetical protein n=1 Tax=Thermoanaerobacterium saccharolyticum TaxID=28896 RepID=UPI002FD960DF